MQLKIKLIKDIGGVYTGYTFRTSIANDPNGSILILQAKDITNTNQPISEVSALSRVAGKRIRSPLFLKQNDVVLVVRIATSGKFRSAVFASSKANVMPSSSIYVIRIKSLTILPMYLSIYLNSVAGQTSMLRKVSGNSYIKNILRSSLCDIAIPVIPMHVQKNIISLQKNIVQQEKILKQKININQAIMRYVMSDFTAANIQEKQLLPQS